MKISKSQLKQIIQEELDQVIKEWDWDDWQDNFFLRKTGLGPLLRKIKGDKPAAGSDAHKEAAEEHIAATPEKHKERAREFAKEHGAGPDEDY
jgi:hypothetical protein